MKKLLTLSAFGIFLFSLDCDAYTGSTTDVHIVSFTQTAETTARIRGVNPGDIFWGVFAGSCAATSGEPRLIIYDSSGTATSTQTIMDTNRYSGEGCPVAGWNPMGPDGVKISSGLTYTNTGGAKVSFLIYNLNISTNSSSD